MAAAALCDALSIRSSIPVSARLLFLRVCLQDFAAAPPAVNGDMFSHLGARSSNDYCSLSGDLMWRERHFRAACGRAIITDLQQPLEFA
nr:hypothetical protein [uncultured Brevundimonas sp.]